MVVRVVVCVRARRAAPLAVDEGRQGRRPLARRGARAARIELPSSLVCLCVYADCVCVCVCFRACLCVSVLVLVPVLYYLYLYMNLYVYVFGGEALELLPLFQIFAVLTRRSGAAETIG